MARYIDADAIMPKMVKDKKFIFRKEDFDECGELVFRTCYAELEDFIRTIPTADVVEVVRCKDCGMSRETEDERYLFCMQFADTVGFQAFCSYGERKCE